MISCWDPKLINPPQTQQQLYHVQVRLIASHHKVALGIISIPSPSNDPFPSKKSGQGEKAGTGLLTNHLSTPKSKRERQSPTTTTKIKKRKKEEREPTTTIKNQKKKEKKEKKKKKKKKRKRRRTKRGVDNRTKNSPCQIKKKKKKKKKKKIGAFLFVQNRQVG